MAATALDLILIATKGRQPTDKNNSFVLVFYKPEACIEPY